MTTWVNCVIYNAVIFLSFGNILFLISGVARSQLLRWAAASFHTSAALEAARKGTRAKAEAKKKASKKEAVKREFIPLKKRLELK